MATTRPRKRPTPKGNAPPKDCPSAPDSLDSPGGIRWLSPEEGRQYFEDEVRKRLGISGDEFLRRLDAGEYQDIPDDPEHWPIIELSMLQDFAR
jgi:hypothetical protein